MIENSNIQKDEQEYKIQYVSDNTSDCYMEIGKQERGWLYKGKACDKLWNKSAIGRPMKGGKLLLTSAEVIFCHEQRNMEYPYVNWLQDAIKMSPRLLDETAILEAIRVSGNKLVMYPNFDYLELIYSDFTWGIRWASGSNLKIDKPVSEVRWFHASENIDIYDLFNWSKQVSERNRIPEILVIDDEHAVVTYRIVIEDPKGMMGGFPEKDLERISQLDCYLLNNGASFTLDLDELTDERIGIPHLGGKLLDATTKQLINSLTDPSQKTVETEILQDLLSRGLYPRPGFKYGTKWRCYNNQVGENHAPWLVVHPGEAPKNWEGTCLASRMASGVGKTWLHPLKIEGVWKYLSITRPPVDARWYNPKRK